MSDDMRGLYVWLDERLQHIATAQAEAHGRLRSDMSAGFSEMRGQFGEVFKQARAISERTLVIETERSMERRAGIKVGAIYGAIAGALTSGLIAASMRAFFG